MRSARSFWFSIVPVTVTVVPRSTSLHDPLLNVVSALVNTVVFFTSNCRVGHLPVSDSTFPLTIACGAGGGVGAGGGLGVGCGGVGVGDGVGVGGGAAGCGD